MFLKEQEKFLTSQKLSKKLKELGFKQNSYFWWVHMAYEGTRKRTWEIDDSEPGESYVESGRKYYSAYSVGELGGMLGKSTGIDFMKAYLDVMALEEVDNFPLMAHNLLTQPDIQAEMLIYLKENKLI